MRFITIFRSSSPPSGPPSAEHIAAMHKQIEEAAAAGVMVTTGGLGFQATTGGRITLDKGKVTVETPPKGDGGWMAAGGFAIVNHETREILIEEMTKQLQTMGDGTVEFVEYKQFYPEPGQAMAQTHVSGDPTMPRGVVPYLSFEGAAKAVDFYKKAFAAKEIARMHGEDGKRIMHCHLEINGGALMLADHFAEFGMQPVQRSESYMMQLIVADGDAWWDRAVKAGCTPRMPFDVAPWGDKYGQMTDPFGVVWAINSPAKK